MNRTADSFERKTGLYLGTEIDGKWWRRYTADGWLTRGAGEYWLDDANVYFKRFLIERILSIPRSDITKVETGNWHSGRWSPNVPIVKIHWSRDGQALSVGLALPRTEADRLSALLGHK